MPQFKATMIFQKGKQLNVCRFFFRLQIGSNFIVRLVVHSNWVILASCVASTRLLIMKAIVVILRVICCKTTRQISKRFVFVSRFYFVLNFYFVFFIEFLFCSRSRCVVLLSLIPFFLRFFLLSFFLFVFS